jgi:hypothetical protein
MKLLSNILAPVCCVTVAEGTQLWKRVFSIFCSKEKEKKRKKQQGTVSAIKRQWFELRK